MRHLEIRGLSSAYGSLPVLQDVSLTVDKGEVVGLIGPSGSGKSTLLRVLVGLSRPTGGEVLIDGERIDYASRAERARARDRMAIVFQQYNLFQNMDVMRQRHDRARQGEAPRPRARSRREAARLLAKRGPRRQAPRLSRTSSRAASSSAWRSPGRWR